MGFFDKLFGFFGFGRREVNVLVVGLNNSGKSTVLNHFKPDDQKAVDIVPTVGFNIEKFSNKNMGFTAFDMAGEGRYRELWEHHYKDCHGVIFVVDSSDALRLVVARDELEALIHHQYIQNRRIPILLFANKMDVRGASSAVRVSASLGLERIPDKPWHICASNALTGEGLQEGIEWLTNQIRSIIDSKS